MLVKVLEYFSQEFLSLQTFFFFFLSYPCDVWPQDTFQLLQTAGTFNATFLFDSSDPDRQKRIRFKSVVI